MSLSRSDMAQESLNRFQVERCAPREINHAFRNKSIIYLPLGTLEWHGEHLPIGLDGLTSHYICLKAAEKIGGLVCPPFFFGLGGGHGAYPWTILMEKQSQIEPLLQNTLMRFQDFGLRMCLIFTGHFAADQVRMIKEIAEKWNKRNDKMKTLALSVSELPNSTLKPDHAGIFETSLLAAISQDLVNIEYLPPVSTHPANDPFDDAWGKHRHNKQHPLYGIFGQDPRTFEMEEGERLLAQMLEWVCDEALEQYRQI